VPEVDSGPVYPDLDSLFSDQELQSGVIGGKEGGPKLGSQRGRNRHGRDPFEGGEAV
jgi:hypothetical protein